jgi:beta-glucosidase
MDAVTYDSGTASTETTRSLSEFYWGTAASATQTEGAAPASNWAVWERAGRVPPSENGNGFWTRFREDFEVLSGLGLRHHRLSLEWARIEPWPSRRDPAAVEHYREVLRAGKEKGMAIWVCLHHFTLPQWFEDEGGFLNRRATDRYWKRHVAFVAETFGDHVFGWKPINEPQAYVAGAYLLGELPPGVRNFEAFERATVGIYEAWRDACEVLGRSKPICTIHNLSPVFPVSEDEAATTLAAALDAFLFGIPLDAFREGIVRLPGRPPVRIRGLEGSSDLFGFSYYSAIGVGKPNSPFDLLSASVPYPPGSEPGPLGYHPWPQGMGIVLDRLANELPGVPLVVSENGIGTRDEDRRVSFLRQSLSQLKQAIDSGIDVRGYFHWTSVDNYEWHHGFDVPFGILDRQRRPKRAAFVLASAVSGGLAESAADSSAERARELGEES